MLTNFYFARRGKKGVTILSKAQSYAPDSRAGIYRRPTWNTESTIDNFRIHLFFEGDGLYVWGRQNAAFVETLSPEEFPSMDISNVELRGLSRHMRVSHRWNRYVSLAELGPGLIPPSYVSHQKCELTGEKADFGFNIVDSTPGHLVGGGSYNRFYVTYHGIKSAKPLHQRRLKCRVCKQWGKIDVLIHRKGGSSGHRTWYLALCGYCRSFPEDYDFPDVGSWEKTKVKQ